MSDYWQVVRRLPEGGHQPIGDWITPDAARTSAALFNKNYQTDEYMVIHRTTEHFVNSISPWWNGKKWAEDL